MSKTLCIYHGNCADGFAAAWCVRKALGEGQVEFVAGVYNDPPPDVTGRVVVIVDFSYKRPVLLEMAAKAQSIVILDHHKTAKEDLVDLPANVSARFDMNESGAMMAWNNYFPDEKPPRLLEHIEDRDLWRFKLEGTREIQAAVFSYPYDFKVWDTLMGVRTDNLRFEGVAIERKHHKDIAELVEVCWYWQMIGGEKVPVASLPYTLTSDAGSLMARRYAPTKFAACYWDTPDGRIFSLRSIDGGMDVGKVAFAYGGGGHAQASGFRVGWDHPLAVAVPFDSSR